MKATMDNKWSMSLTDSESDILLLLSSDTSQPGAPERKAMIEHDSENFIRAGASENDVEATVYASDMILRQMKVKNRPTSRKDSSFRPDDEKIPRKKTHSQPENPESELSHNALEKEDDILAHRLKNNKSEDSSRITAQTSRSSEKTGKSSIRSWLRRKVLRRNDHSRRNSHNTDTVMPWYDVKESKPIPDQVMCNDGNQDANKDTQDGFSDRLGSMSVSEFQKVIETSDSQEISHAAVDHSKFKNYLEIYKAASRTESDERVLAKFRRPPRDPSFTLISFSLAPSESDEYDDTSDDDNEDGTSEDDEVGTSDEDYTDGDSDTFEDNLPYAIAKEMNLRRLIMGDEKQEPALKIQSVSIPTPKTPNVLSPRMNTQDERDSPERRSTTMVVNKPQTPLQQLTGFFFSCENRDSPGPSTCGGDLDLQTVPTVSLFDSRHGRKG